jgi:hypothetical protein
MNGFVRAKGLPSAQRGRWRRMTLSGYVDPAWTGMRYGNSLYVVSNSLLGLRNSLFL